MCSKSTVSEMTLTTMRREIAADSPLFAEQLAQKPQMEANGFSNVFVAAHGGTPAGQTHYCFALEYIFEGYLLHYGESRLLATDQRELALLAGDYMYARGLNLIAALNDLLAVKALAKLIEFCSFIHCRAYGQRLALETWASVTLYLAGRAAGTSDMEKTIWPELSGFMRETLGGASDNRTPSELIERMLSQMPADRRKETTAILDNIFADPHPAES